MPVLRRGSAPTARFPTTRWSIRPSWPTPATGDSLATALLPHGRSVFDGTIQAASLDHAIWFHRPFRADEWLLYAMDAPNRGGRPRLHPWRRHRRQWRACGEHRSRGADPPRRPNEALISGHARCSPRLARVARVPSRGAAADPAPPSRPRLIPPSRPRRRLSTSDVVGRRARVHCPTSRTDPTCCSSPSSACRRVSWWTRSSDARSEGRSHDAIDIMAPRGRAVVAAAPGRVVRLFTSDKGGITVYVLGLDDQTVYLLRSPRRLLTWPRRGRRPRGRRSHRDGGRYGQRGRRATRTSTSRSGRQTIRPISGTASRSTRTRC